MLFLIFKFILSTDRGKVKKNTFCSFSWRLKKIHFFIHSTVISEILILFIDVFCYIFDLSDNYILSVSGLRTKMVLMLLLKSG